MRLGLLSPLALSALAGAYTLSGTLVVSGSSLPLSGATVRLAQRSDIPSAVSDAKGAFRLTDQATGVTSSPQHSRLKHPNAFDLYDMTGNYQQWTGDLYGAYRADGGQPIPVGVIVFP